MKMDFAPYIELLFPPMLMGITGAAAREPIKWGGNYSGKLLLPLIAQQASQLVTKRGKACHICYHATQCDIHQCIMCYDISSYGVSFLLLGCGTGHGGMVVEQKSHSIPSCHVCR